MAASLRCTLVPAPIFCVDPMRMRTAPAFTFPKRASFFASVSVSWMNATSPSGTPRASSLRRRSSYTLKDPSPFGVERSQNTSWVSLSSAPSRHMRSTFSQQAFTLLPSKSGSAGSARRWSRAILRPSLVMRSMLSFSAGTLPALTASARSASPATSSRWTGEGCTATLRRCTLGVGSASVSAVCTSATCLNMDMSSGRL